MITILSVIIIAAFLSWAIFWAGVLGQGIEFVEADVKLLCAGTGLVWMAPIAFLVTYFCVN